MINYAENIKRICDKKGLRVKDLAEILNITPVGLSKSINQDYPQIQTLERIAKALNIELEEIFAVKPKHYCPHCGKEIKIKLE